MFDLATVGNGGASASCDQLAEATGAGGVPQLGRKGAKPLKGVASQASGRNTQRCLVTNLDGTQQQFYADPDAPGGALFEAVCDCLNITEREYFGVSFRSDKDSVWLDREKKLGKQTNSTLSLSCCCSLPYFASTFAWFSFHKFKRSDFAICSASGLGNSTQNRLPSFDNFKQHANFVIAC